MEIQSVEILKKEIKKYFQSLFYYFIVQGFTIANISIFVGLFYSSNLEFNYMMYFFMCMPILCMVIAYKANKTLFYRGFPLKLREYLQYIFIGIFCDSFCLAIIFNKFSISPFALIAYLYTLIFLVDIVYWKLYIKIYYPMYLIKYLMMDLPNKGQEA